MSEKSKVNQVTMQKKITVQGYRLDTPEGQKAFIEASQNPGRKTDAKELTTAQAELITKEGNNNPSNLLKALLVHMGTIEKKLDILIDLQKNAATPTKEIQTPENKGRRVSSK